MYAVVVANPGGTESMQWQEEPDPQVGPGEVLIEVAATAVNRADVLQRMGFYPPPPGASDILGLECSGIVTAVGPDVDESRIGDSVCALLTGGGYAQRVVAPVGQVMTLPAGIDVIKAAGIPEVACTAWSNLADVAGMAAGDFVLLHGGAGGIGTFSIQLARAFGATVGVTAGSAEKLAICRDLGAEVLINYNEGDFVEDVKYVTSGRGADIILDNMGAKYLQRNVDALAVDGRLVVIGMQGGIKAELNLATLLSKRAAIHATSLRSRAVEQKAQICANVVDRVWPLIEDGRIKPIVDSVLPISEVAAAHQRMEDSHHVGKIILTVP
ncbi:MAG: NAD(P)H-quinone oxidoreductase [Candidatus Nanopelagicales bacterium]